MRILQAFGEPFSYGGQERFVMNAIDHMDLRGMEIDLLTPYYCDNEAAWEQVRQLGGEIYALGCSFRPGRSRADAAGPIYGFLKDRHYDLIHIHSGSSSMLAIYAMAARAAGIGRIIVHSHCTGRDDLRHRASRLATMPMLQACATDWCACSEEAGRWRFPRAVCDSRLTVLRNGIDAPAFAFDEESRRSIRLQYGIGEDKVLIGTFGRLTYQKNQIFMLRLLRRIVSERPDGDRYVLMLTGDGEDKEMLMTHARMMGLEDRVIFTGATGSIGGYYSAIDVLAVPSVYEGFGIVVLEAQAAGLEVIASGAVPEAADAAGRVRIIDLGDRDAWIEALTAEHERHKGTASLIRQAGYGIEETAEAVRELYISRQQTR